MRPLHKILAMASLAALLCALAPACKTKSAWDKVLSERARWSVLALDWTQGQDHTVQLSTRLSGPPNSPLETLTVRVELSDAAGATITEVWHVYDLTEVPRGGPKDFILRIPAEGPAEGLVVDVVPRPQASDQPNIPELGGLTP